MAYIDLVRQAQPQQRKQEVLVSTEVTQSSGLFEWEQKKMTPEFIGSGSLDLAQGDLTTGNISASNISLLGGLYASSSFGNSLAITFPIGFMSGSVKVHGDLIVEGSSSFNNVETMTVEDPILDLNFTGSTALGSQDSGIRVGRSGGTNAQLIFDHSETRWAIDNAAGSNINIVGVSTTDTLTNKTITGLASSTMASAANLTFSGDGEVLGLPTTPSDNAAATSKIYVDQRDSYLRKCFVKKAASYTGSATFGDFSGFKTGSFNAITASAPTGFSATNENDFIFFLNGQYMEHDALTIKQSGSLFQVEVDTDSIGYVLEASDEILAWGKFDS
jgi:hypothetical protein|tara:strand:- start:546 stop:1541 length:996 start_codon:yes stop_codon:yes gene_type:complete